MRAVVQRVLEARVEVDGRVSGEIGCGLVVFLGVARDDGPADVNYLVTKISGLRVFEDNQGLMNHSVRDKKGAVLCVSQFTLLGDCRKGRRPGFSAAALPGLAEELYDSFCRGLRETGLVVETGCFQAEMRVLVDNQGPVTMLIDSKKIF